MSNRLISKSFFKDIKLNIPLVVLYSIFLFLFMFVSVLISYSDYKTNLDYMEEVYKMDTFFNFRESAIGYLSAGSLLVFIFAAVQAFNQFNYLHSKTKVDFYHSLPQSRLKLFTTKYLSGLLEGVIPYAIIWLLSFILCHFVAPMPGIKIDYFFFYAFLSVIVFYVMLYSSCVLAMILSGTNFTGICMMFVINFIFPIFALILNGFYSVMSYDFYKLYESESPFAKFVEELPERIGFISPISQIFTVYDGYFIYQPRELMEYYSKHMEYYTNHSPNYGRMENPTIQFLPFRFPAYVVITILIVVVAYLAYKHMKLERTGEALTFKKSESFFITLLTICAGLIGCLFFNEFAGFDATGYAYFGGILFTFLSYGIIQFIYTKDIKKTFQRKWILIISEILVFIIISLVWSFS